MGKTINGGIGIGIGSNPQMSFMQTEFDAKIKQLLKNEQKPFNSSLFSYAESREKYDGYLLDLNHVRGGSKAKFLKNVLGYKTGDGELLHKAISEAIDGKLPNKVVKTEYGTKYNFNAKIKGKDGTYHSANMTVVVQNDHGKTTWRLITLTPDDKD